MFVNMFKMMHVSFICFVRGTHIEKKRTQTNKHIATFWAISNLVGLLREHGNTKSRKQRRGFNIASIQDLTQQVYRHGEDPAMCY